MKIFKNKRKYWRYFLVSGCARGYREKVNVEFPTEISLHNL